MTHIIQRYGLKKAKRNKHQSRLYKSYRGSVVKYRDHLKVVAVLEQRIEALEKAEFLLWELDSYLDKGTSKTSIHQGSIFHQTIKSVRTALQESNDG